MTPVQRYSILKQKGLCHQCLFPGASQSFGKHQDGNCQRDFICPHSSHDRYTCKKHVLVCQDHATDQENDKILQLYKQRCIERQQSLLDFSKDIKLTFHSDVESSHISNRNSVGEDSVSNRAIYIFQTIDVDGKRYTIFFDLGCSDMVIRKHAASNLNHRCQLEYKGDVTISGVGQSSQKSMGIYKIKLPLYNGQDATLSGVCLHSITSTFPTYPLQQVEMDIHQCYMQQGGDPNSLPSLAPIAGGDVDIMLGIKYLRYHPKAIFQLPSGLTIYESMFVNADGGRGVVGGPHEVFNTISKFIKSEKELNTFITHQYEMYKAGFFINPDASLLHFKADKDHNKNLFFNNNTEGSTALTSRNQKAFEEVEEAGSSISYRCVKCRNCHDCREGEIIESISIKEEVEQHLINQSITVDVVNRVSWASLPLLHNPEVKLAPNKNKALQTYYQQLKKLDRSPQDKDDVMKSEAKLQQMGFVDYVKNLTKEQQEMLRSSPIQNFIPWRAVWKGNSLSTPCRVVFDASQPTSTGYSLNSILAKGTNNMNRLVEILIRWTMYHTAFHTDVRKMYNTVKLKENYWCLQRYIWQAELDRNQMPEEKVIKTLIYGVKSSGNQSERALRETSRISKDEYPDAYNTIQKDIYVDDCLSGDESTTKAH